MVVGIDRHVTFAAPEMQLHHFESLNEARLQPDHMKPCLCLCEYIYLCVFVPAQDTAELRHKDVY